MQRLDRIAENRPLLWFVIDEVAVRRVVGGAEVMKGQLEHLLQLMEAGTIRLNVLPDTPRRPGLSEPYRIMTLSDHQSVAYTEHVLGGQVYYDRDPVAKLTTMFCALQAEALPRSATEALICGIAKVMTR